MKISVDGKAVDDSAVTGDNLEEILDDLAERFVDEDYVISEVRVNGRTYSEDVPHAAVEIGRPGIEHLELFTRSPRELAEHFLKNGHFLVDALLESLPRINDMFRLGDETEANEHFLRFLESLHLLVGMLEKVGTVLDVQFNLPIQEQDTLNEHLSRLAETLGQLLTIQEQTDWIYLADVLEYELAPQLETIRDLLPHLADRQG